VNEVICHGIPDRRPLENGDILNIDISIYLNGYHSDLNETYLVGEVDQESKHLVSCAYNSLMKAIEICKPGALYKEIGNVVANHIESNGLSVVKTYCGHGVGKLFHTTPNIPHYKNNKAVGSMKAGHIFTIEPMINQGTWKDVTWMDDWTAVTADGKRSAQFEHTILITETGCEILTARTEDSPPLEFLI
jgi:methionyl aminopeptidase